MLCGGTARTRAQRDPRTSGSPNHRTQHPDGQMDSVAGGVPPLLSPVSHCISNGFRIPVYGHGPVSHSLPPARNVTSVAGFMEPWSRTSCSACSGSTDLPAMGCISLPHQHRHRDCPHLGTAELSLSPRKRVGASTELAISDSRFFNPIAGGALARGRQTAARFTDGETEAQSAMNWVRPWSRRFLPQQLVPFTALAAPPEGSSHPSSLPPPHPRCRGRAPLPGQRGAAWTQPLTVVREEKTAPGSRRRRHVTSGAEPRASGLAVRSRARM